MSNDRARLRYFEKITEKNLLSEKQIKAFEYIVKYGPITANELSTKITEEEGETDAYGQMSWNKIPSQLEAFNVVKVSGNRPCTSPLTKNKSRKSKEWDISFKEPRKQKRLNPKVNSLLEQAQNSALLAVEVYNKPKIEFKSETYITLMLIAWTKVFHAYFLETGVDYHYNNGEDYQLTEDGEKKSWDLQKCIKIFNSLSEPIKKNLEVHIKIRNRIVHGSVDLGTFDAVFFPECQSLLYNFENFIVGHFGDEYALNQALAYSLQFSALRTDGQNKALHDLSYMKAGKLMEFLDIFRMSLTEETFNSTEYGVRLISIPHIQNNGRRGVPIEFVNWDNLDEHQKESLSKINSIIKTKREIKPVSNVGKVKAKDIIKKIKEMGFDFNQYLFKCFCYIYSIRPYKEDGKDKNDVIGKLCVYDDLHSDYIYYPVLAEIIVIGLKEKKFLCLN